MSDARSLTRDERALKSVTGALVEEVGGAKAALAVLKPHGHTPSLTTIYNYSDHNDGKHFMPIHYVAILEKAAGRPIVTSFLADELGAEVVPVEGNGEPVSICLEEVAATILRFSRKATALKSAYDAATQDGVIDETDKRELRRVAQAVQRFAFGFARSLEGRTS